MDDEPDLKALTIAFLLIAMLFAPIITAAIADRIAQYDIQSDMRF